MCLDLFATPPSGCLLGGSLGSRPLGRCLLAGALVAALRTDALTAVFFTALVTFLAGDFVALTAFLAGALVAAFLAGALVAAFLAGALVAAFLAAFVAFLAGAFFATFLAALAPTPRLTAGPSAGRRCARQTQPL